MSAPTEPKRQPKHVSSGGEHRKKPYGWWIGGGVFFLAAWLVWAFVISVPT